jgi:hypothetical protein
MVRRSGIQTAVAVAAVTGATLWVAACGSGEGGGAPVSPSGVTDSATATTTQPTPRSTTSAGGSATSMPDPDAASMVDVAVIEAAVYADIAARFADASADYYPGTLDCGSGSVAVGSALQCSYVPDEPLEFVGPFVVVLDAERIVWTSAPCCDGAPLPQAYPVGAFCRDLAAPPSDAPREVRDGRTLDPSPDYHLSYGLAVWYWYAEGRPDRMDADLDGIPCETVYDSDEIAAFWDSAISLG